ncbi:RimK/LysX family protein [Photobacterium japonica]|uniref:putative ATP-dependent zinc protease n=1 Tax=Photobacterium japonica TaxID=2910235 RepID=UPI003D0EBC82
MKRSIACGILVLLAGCAQQTSQRTPSPSEVEQETAGTPVGGIDEATPMSPSVTPLPKPEVTLPTEPVPLPVVVQPTVKTPVTPKPQPKPVPLPVVTKSQDGKYILGREEWVWLPGAKTHVKAAVDKDKTLSSIGVTSVKAFERDGKEWVKFKAGDQRVELPVERWVKPKNGGNREAVVKLRAKLGELNELTEFVLTAGQGIVLGINFIRDVATVDSQRTFVQPKTK